jgi:DNA-binding transcriptional ArsR family regulator
MDTMPLKALADETRLRVVELLLTQDLCVGALAHRLGVSKPAVSQHLQVLRKAGLVRGEKRGYWTHYGVERENLRRLAVRLEEMADLPMTRGGACLRLASAAPEPAERRASEICCMDCCREPQKHKGEPEACNPEQIKACHADVAGHPCESGEKKVVLS